MYKKSANLPDSLTPRILPLGHTLFMKALQGPAEGRTPELSSFQGQAPAMIIFFPIQKSCWEDGKGEREYSAYPGTIPLSLQLVASIKLIKLSL